MLLLPVSLSLSSTLLRFYIHHRSTHPPTQSPLHNHSAGRSPTSSPPHHGIHPPHRVLSGSGAHSPPKASRRQQQTQEDRRWRQEISSHSSRSRPTFRPPPRPPRRPHCACWPAQRLAPRCISTVKQRTQRRKSPLRQRPSTPPPPRRARAFTNPWIPPCPEPSSSAGQPTATRCRARRSVYRAADAGEESAGVARCETAAAR